MSDLSFEKRLSNLETKVKHFEEERRKEIEFERDIITQKMFHNLISMRNTSLAFQIADELGIRDRLQDWQIRYLDYVLKGDKTNE